MKTNQLQPWEEFWEKRNKVKLGQNVTFLTKSNSKAAIFYIYCKKFFKMFKEHRKSYTSRMAYVWDKLGPYLCRLWIANDFFYILQRKIKEFNGGKVPDNVITSLTRPINTTTPPSCQHLNKQLQLRTQSMLYWLKFSSSPSIQMARFGLFSSPRISWRFYRSRSSQPSTQFQLSHVFLSPTFFREWRGRTVGTEVSECNADTQKLFCRYSVPKIICKIIFILKDIVCSL